MVGAVALQHAALVAPLVAGLAGRERAQAEGGQEAPLHGLDDARGALALDQRQGQTADGEDLVRPERRIGGPFAVIRIDDVVETSERVVPEALAEGAEAALEHLVPSSRAGAADPQRVEP